MVDAYEVKVPDVQPAVFTIEILDNKFKPIGDLKFKVKLATGASKEKKTDKDGIFKMPKPKGGEKVYIEEQSESKIASSSKPKNYYPENLGPLMVLDLRNRSDGGQGPLAKGDTRKALIEHLQKLLSFLGYSLVRKRYRYIPEEFRTGIDGIFGEMTEEAVRNFQVSTVDWTGKPLAKDGLVGPLTADALNRSMVGFWYDVYSTPTELTGKGPRLVTITESYMKNTGLDL